MPLPWVSQHVPPLGHRVESLETTWPCPAMEKTKTSSFSSPKRAAALRPSQLQLLLVGNSCEGEGPLVPPQPERPGRRQWEWCGGGNG